MKDWLTALRTRSTTQRRTLSFRCADRSECLADVTAQRALDPASVEGQGPVVAVVEPRSTVGVRASRLTSDPKGTSVHRTLHGGPEWGRAMVEAADDAGVGLAIVTMEPTGPHLADINSVGLRLLDAPNVKALAARDNLFLTKGLAAMLRRRAAGPAVPPKLVHLKRPEGDVRVIELGLGTGTYWGRPAVVAFFTDVTERERIARVLRETEARLHLVLERVPLALVTTNDRGIVTDVRGGASSEFGIGHEAVGTPAARLAKRAPEVAEALATALRGNPTTAILDRRGGRWGLTCMPMTSEVEHPHGAIAMLHDVSSVMDIEAASRYVAESQREATKLRQLNEYKSRIINRFAQQLHTPVTALAHTLGTLTRDANRLPEQDATAVRRLGRHVRQLREMVALLLDVSRLEVGEARIIPAQFDLGGLIDETAAAARPAAGKPPVRRRRGPAPVYADRARLRDAIESLLRALDQDEAPSAPPEIIVEPASPWGVVTIRSAAACGRFVASFNAFAEGVPKESGTARSSLLGLEIYHARLVIERSHGTIDVTCSPRETTVRLRLPLSSGGSPIDM